MFTAIWIGALTVVVLVAVCAALEPAYSQWKFCKYSKHVDHHLRKNAAEHWINHCVDKPCEEATEFFSYQKRFDKNSTFYYEQSAKAGDVYFNRFPEQKPKPKTMGSVSAYAAKKVDWRKRLREEEERKIREEQAKNIVENGIGNLKVFRG